MFCRPRSRRILRANISFTFSMLALNIYVDYSHTDYRLQNGVSHEN